MAKHLGIILFLFCVTSACNSTTESMTAKQIASVNDSVQKMVDQIAKEVSQQGPVAWLHYFEHTSEFFMAVQGQLVFPNDDSATNFINNTLVKSISRITLHWSNIRIDPMSLQFANIAANFHEDVTDAGGQTTSTDGYFTGTAHQTTTGWVLRNAHWSSVNPR